MNASLEVSNSPNARGKLKFAWSNKVPGTWLSLVLVAGVALGLSSCKSWSAKGGDPEPVHDPVAECRELAPEDPYEDDEEGAEMAYSACYEAAQLAPNDAETLYRLGTSAFQSQRMEEAVENFRKAEQLDYCKALYFLGEDAWYGQKDATRAEDYYKRGAACGDERAAAEIFSPRVFERSARPEIIEALYHSDIEKLNKVRFVTASYVAGFYEALCEQYQGKDMDTCWKATYCRGGEIQNQLQAAEKGDAPNIVEGLAYEWLLPKAYQVLVPGLGSQAVDEFRKSERVAGSGDELRMVESSKCNALLPHRIVTGLETFAKTKKSLVEVGRTSSPNVRSVGDLSAWLQQQKPK